ncbi:putative phage abortive infection protein [Pseudoalteromonas sp. MMG006]|uniref:putative phage abortive infection protein n=1 Tax=Pseudoalteromonas sp. MMG006 TaxID=2822683 RepID=UPI001B36E9A6|nr:putative phage abortive infection protein [Pseudoalteromonas sp. MMG006]MBQ4800895.1 putative phage abortive infection protein [Pseudoalteromonas sp. MMG006]
MKDWFKNRLNGLNGYLDQKYPDFEAIFTESDGDKKSLSLNKVLFKVLSFAVLSAGLLLIINLALITFTDRGGVFGDFLGGVLNPILTFFTLFGLIATIVIQRQELRLARHEYEKTADALSTQAIETTFFNILDLHHKIVDNLKVDLEELSYKSKGESLSSKKTKVEGRAVFEEILTFLSVEAKTPDDALDRYKNLQKHHNHILGHYFRNLYQALKIIDGYEENKLTYEEKRKYSSILRAQLSTKELALLFVNCLESVSDSGQFKNLLVEFQMLEHLPIQKRKDGYSLAGSKVAIASEDMLLQYKEKKEVGVNLKKYYGGAFGTNGGVPYNLSPNKSMQPTADASAD